MRWIILAQTVPGQQLAQNVLDANLVSVLGLIIALLAVAVIIVSVCGVVMMYYNSQAVSKMSQTQQNMSNANAQWAASDSEKTAALKRSVDELMLFRQDYGNSNSAHQHLAEQTKVAIDAHEDKTEERVKSIIEQVTRGTEGLHGALKAAVTSVNSSTQATVKPALDALDKLVLLGDGFSTREESTREMLKKQHEEDMQFLQDQHEAHMRIWRDSITEAQQAILSSLKKSEEKSPHENPEFVPLPTPLMVTSHDPLLTNLEPAEPDAVSTRPGKD